MRKKNLTQKIASTAIIEIKSMADETR